MRKLHKRNRNSEEVRQPVDSRFRGNDEKAEKGTYAIVFWILGWAGWVEWVYTWGAKAAGRSLFRFWPG